MVPEATEQNIMLWKQKSVINMNFPRPWLLILCNVIKHLLLLLTQNYSDLLSPTDFDIIWQQEGLF